MTQIQFENATTVDKLQLFQLLTEDSKHPHIHLVDMPYRLASRWQEAGCEMGVWQEGDQLVGWALFQPPWWNLDYAIMPSFQGGDLEEEILHWGHQQMVQYSEQTGEQFWGSVELFDDHPQFTKSEKILNKLGFKKFDWSMNRLALDLTQSLPEHELPDGFGLRPYNPNTDPQAYVDLQRAAFDSENMTLNWRKRIIEQPNYNPELDLIMVNEKQEAVGFCICWLVGEIGQIEPLGVHPSVQGKGLGRALEISAYQQLQKFGAKKLLIDHASFNEKAIRLSLNTGFRQTHNASRYFLEIPE